MYSSHEKVGTWANEIAQSILRSDEFFLFNHEQVLLSNMINHYHSDHTHEQVPIHLIHGSSGYVQGPSSELWFPYEFEGDFLHDVKQYRNKRMLGGWFSSSSTSEPRGPGFFFFLLLSTGYQSDLSPCHM
jgi:hypothetical protein